MAEAELPPPYSPADEQQPNSTPQPSLHPSPSTTPSLRPSPDPGLRPSPGPSSNLTLPFLASESDRSSGALPPSYLNLTTFSIGTKKIKKPLVMIEHIQSHLRLMRAFKLFQEKVEDPYSDPEGGSVLPPIGKSIGVKGRWLWFLEMAVERYLVFVWSDYSRVLI